MLNHLPKLLNTSTVPLPKNLFPDTLSGETAATFQTALRNEFDKALVNYLLAIKLSNNIKIEKKLTPTDRAYIHTYYTIYHSLQMLNGLLILAFAYYINKNIELPIGLGFVTYVTIVNLDRHVATFDLLQQRLLISLYPSLEKDSENLKTALKDARFNTSFSFSIVIAIGMYVFGVQAIGKSTLAFFFALSLSGTFHSFLDPLTYFLAKNIVASSPTAVQEKDMQSAESEISLMTSKYMSPGSLASLQQLQEESLNNYRSAWQYKPDSFLSARYQLSVQINPHDDSANIQLLPGYHGQAEKEANRIYQEHETAGTLDSCRGQIETLPLSSFESVIEKALESLSHEDQKTWQAYLVEDIGKETSLNAIADIVTKQLIMIFLSRCHQRFISKDELQSPVDFLYSILLYQYALIPLKERHTIFNDNLTRKIILSNVPDVIGQNQMLRAASFPKHIRHQTPTIMLHAHIDTKHFLTLVDTFTLFQPAKKNNKGASPFKKTY